MNDSYDEEGLVLSVVHLMPFSLYVRMCHNKSVMYVCIYCYVHQKLNWNAVSNYVGSDVI